MAIHFEEKQPRKAYSYSKDFHHLCKKWVKKAIGGKKEGFRCYQRELHNFTAREIEIQIDYYLSELKDEDYCCHLSTFFNGKIDLDFEYAEEKPKTVSPPGWDDVECKEKERWDTVINAVISAGYVSRIEAETWLAGLKIASWPWEGSEIKVLAPTAFTRDYVKSNHADMIRQVTGCHIEIEAYKEGEDYGQNT